MNQNNAKISFDKKYLDILQSASNLAISKGYKSITRRELSKLVGCSPSLITYYFNDMESLKNELLNYAIQKEIIPIIIQNLAFLESTNIDLSDSLKEKIKNYF